MVRPFPPLESTRSISSLRYHADASARYPSGRFGVLSSFTDREHVHRTTGAIYVDLCMCHSIFSLMQIEAAAGNRKTHFTPLQDHRRGGHPRSGSESVCTLSLISSWSTTQRAATTFCFPDQACRNLQNREGGRCWTSATLVCPVVLSIGVQETIENFKGGIARPTRPPSMGSTVSWVASLRAGGTVGQSQRISQQRMRVDFGRTHRFALRPSDSRKWRFYPTSLN